MHMSILKLLGAFLEGHLGPVEVELPPSELCNYSDKTMDPLVGHPGDQNWPSLMKVEGSICTTVAYISCGLLMFVGVVRFHRHVLIYMAQP